MGTKNYMDLWESRQILEGGVESGFRSVKPTEYKPRLLHVCQPNKKKRKKIRVDEVPLNIESLNNDDVFVLDEGLKFYEFRAPKANTWEKRAANAYVNKLKGERNKSEGCIVEWSDSGADADAFWAHFNGKPDSLPDTSART